MDEADRENTSEPVASREKGFVVEIAGLPPVRFLGWRSGHAEVMVTATRGKMKWRAVVDARAECPERYGAFGAIGRAILRPGDTFDRETGKMISLARLVEALVPATSAYAMDDARASIKALRIEQKKIKAARSRLFQEIWKRTHHGALPKRPGRAYVISDMMKVFAPEPRAIRWFTRRYENTVAVPVEGITPPLTTREVVRGGGLPSTAPESAGKV